MKVKITATGLISALWHGMELDIPEEVIKGGDESILKWCNDHINTVDFAPIREQTTYSITEVHTAKVETR